MSARIFTIGRKRKFDPTAPVQLDDFEYQAGPSIDPGVILSQPTVSLYCLDHDRRQAIFVETAPGVDLSAEPFFYQGQYREAERLIAVSYDALHIVAGGVAGESLRMILVYSVGRCGSTLVSRVFNQAENVVSLSEPDVYTQLLMLRRPDGANANEVNALLRSCTTILCAAATRGTRTTTCALKFRSWGIELGDLLYRNFPHASVIFLYRHAELWLRSTARAFRLLDPLPQEVMSHLQQSFGTLFPFLATYTAKNMRTLSMIELQTSMWIAVMERCLDLQCQGTPIFAARYEDLKQNPHAVLEGIFSHCGVSLREKGGLEQVLAKDSQAGTSLSQARVQECTDGIQGHHLTEMREFMRKHSNLRPDTSVPDMTVLNMLRI